MAGSFKKMVTFGKGGSKGYIHTLQMCCWLWWLLSTCPDLLKKPKVTLWVNVTRQTDRHKHKKKSNIKQAKQVLLLEWFQVHNKVLIQARLSKTTKATNTSPERKKIVTIWRLYHWERHCWSSLKHHITSTLLSCISDSSTHSEDAGNASQAPWSAWFMKWTVNAAIAQA